MELNRRKRLTPEKSDVLDLFLESLGTVGELKTFVCSFSEEGDLLSQWRAYSREGGGLSLGFNFHIIERCANRQGYRLEPCIYDNNKKKVAISNLLDRLIQKQKNNPVLSKEQMRSQFLDEVIQIAPFMKDTSFQEEREWRCSLFPSEKQLHDVKHRAVSSVIIPYHEFNLVDEGNLSIKRIFIGPNEHRDLQMSAVSDVLWCKGIRRDQIDFSSIPYRVFP
jgi:hypothetical protein